jgi:hypothetical protein
MRAGRPDELRVQAFPVLTARISEAELSSGFRFPFSISPIHKKPRAVEGCVDSARARRILRALLG